MDEQIVKEYANQMLDKYDELIRMHTGAYDVTAHNLCIAIVQRSAGERGGGPRMSGKVYWSYSNPSGLNVQARGALENVLVPYVQDPNVKLPNYSKDTRSNLHTEIRLLNYLYSIDQLSNNAVVTLISSRTICNNCWNAIWDTQQRLAANCALLGLECKAELPVHELKVWVANADRATDKYGNSVWETRTGRPIFMKRRNGISPR